MAAHRTDIRRRLAATVAGSPGRVSAALTAGDGWAWEHEAHRAVPAASTIKLPLLLAALAEVDAGRLDLDDQVILPARRVGGSGPLWLLPSVASLPLDETLRLMVALSDNDAANAVLDLVGTAAVEDLLQRVPTRHTRLQRRLMDFAAARAGRENETSAADLVETVAALRRGRLVSAEATATAVGVLRAQQLRAGLPGYLPGDVAVASKTGDLPGVRAEVALLERGNRWVAVAVTATGLAAEGVDRGTAVLPFFATLGEVAAQLL